LVSEYFSNHELQVVPAGRIGERPLLLCVGDRPEQQPRSRTRSGDKREVAGQHRPVPAASSLSHAAHDDRPPQQGQRLTERQDVQAHHLFPCPGETMGMSREDSFRLLTTRRYHPGLPAIALQVNSVASERNELELETRGPAHQRVVDLERTAVTRDGPRSGLPLRPVASQGCPRRERRRRGRWRAARRGCRRGCGLPVRKGRLLRSRR
jgi:hypothetical protein